MTRREELDDIFKDIDINEKRLVNYLIDDIIFLEEQMTALKKLPMIRVNPKNSSIQEVTKASLQYKAFSQSYMNAIRILCGLLRRTEGAEVDPVNEFLKGLNSVEIR